MPSSREVKRTTSSGGRHRIVHHSKIGRRSSAQGQNENSPLLGLCQLLPAAPDIGLPMLPPPCANTGREQVQQSSLFDDLVGDSHDARGDDELERFGSIQVNHKLELCRQQNRQVSGLGAPSTRWAGKISAGGAFFARHDGTRPPTMSFTIHARVIKAGDDHGPSPSLLRRRP